MGEGLGVRALGEVLLLSPVPNLTSRYTRFLRRMGERDGGANYDAMGTNMDEQSRRQTKKFLKKKFDGIWERESR
jgi:hypothetical protein